MSEEKSMTIYILGRYDCPRLTHCKALISDLISKNPSFQKVEFITCFETQFDLYRDELMKENLSFVNYTYSPIIYLQNEEKKYKKIIGSLEEFQTFLVQNYNYHDMRQTSDFEEETKQNLKNFLSSNGNKYVYMDFASDDEKEEKYEKVVFELFNKECPLTSDNFYETCIGFSNNKGQKISYENTIIHRVSKNSFIQGGDIRIDGPKSKYGFDFNDENYNIKHDSFGILGMVKKGNRKHTNESQFYITLCPLKSFDGKFVAFGRVIKGYDTIIRIGNVDTDLQRPIVRVYVKKCGEFVIE